MSSVQRMSIRDVDPEAYRAVAGLSRYVCSGGLDEGPLREAGGLFSEREQAALAFTEAVTLISEDGVPDHVWNGVTAVFDDKETIHLLMAIATIKVYNRMNVTAGTALGPEPVLPG